MEQTSLPSDEFVEQCQKIVEDLGLKATIGR